MPYYDHIAKKWHSFTGAHGGAFKMESGKF
jgi:hypothetical protein